MKHTNKKGFTIVELVIVIAVIAILAAVLIPTFSNLIKKANISNDTAVAKNLNTAAISAQADTFAKAIAAAKDAGYLVAHLNAKADGCYFVWEQDTKQFILFDIEKGKVLYSNTTVGGDAPDDSWYFVVNNVEDKNTVLAAWEGVNVQYLVGDVAAIKDVLAAGGEVYIDESLALDNENVLYLNSNATINLGSSALNTAGIVKIDNTQYPIDVAAGADVTINGGYIAAASEVYNLDGKLISTVLHTTAGSKLTVNDTQFDSATYNTQMKLEGEVTFNNVVIKATKSGLDTRGNALVTLNNVTINVVDSNIAAGYGCWVWACDTPHGEAYTAKIVINSGTYTREVITNSAVQGGLNSCGGTIEVNGGTFTAEDNKYFSFYSNTAGEIIIKGGTFGGKTFGDADFNEAYLLSLCVKVGNNDNADVYSVTKDPETGYFTITRK